MPDTRAHHRTNGRVSSVSALFAAHVGMRSCASRSAGARARGRAGFTGRWCIPAARCRSSWTIRTIRSGPTPLSRCGRRWPTCPDCFICFEPGARPRLILAAARRTSGTSPPSCRGLLDAPLRHPRRRRPRRGARAAAGGSLPAPPTSATPTRARRLGTRRREPPKMLLRSWIFARAVKSRLRARLPARGEPPGRARAPAPPLAAFARRAFRIRDPAGVPRRLRAARAGTALQPDHRPQCRRLPCCTTRCCEQQRPARAHTPCSSTPAPSSPAMPATSRAPTRCGRCRVRGPRRAHGRACSRRCAPRCAPGVDWREVHLLAHRLTGELLREADLIAAASRKPSAPALSACSCRMASDTCWDSGARCGRPACARPRAARLRARRTSYLRLTRALEAGFVVTMEPGHLFHRAAAGGGARRCARTAHQLAHGSKQLAPLRWHPHRG